MDDYLTTRSSNGSDVAHLRHRHSVPDVPVDVEDELLQHFNDPNWDFEAETSTVTITTTRDGLPVLKRRWSKSSGVGAGTDTESQISSWPASDSKADFSSETETTQVQSAHFLRSPRFFYSSLHLSEILPIQKLGQPSRILTIRPCM